MTSEFATRIGMSASDMERSQRIADRHRRNSAPPVIRYAAQQDGRFLCPAVGTCSRTFSTRAWLTRHLAAEHPELLPPLPLATAPEAPPVPAPPAPLLAPISVLGHNYQWSDDNEEETLLNAFMAMARLAAPAPPARPVPPAPAPRPRFPCPIGPTCGRDFKSQGALTRHTNLDHPGFLPPRPVVYVEIDYAATRGIGPIETPHHLLYACTALAPLRLEHFPGEVPPDRRLNSSAHARFYKDALRSIATESDEV